MEQATSRSERITLEDMIGRLTRLNELRDFDEIMQALNALMEAVGTYTKADRAYIFENKPESPDLFANTVEWCAEGVQPQKDGLQSVFAGDFPYWYQAFKSGKSIVISDVESVRYTMPGEYLFLVAQKVHSVIAFPLFFDGTVLGFIGVDNPEIEKSREFINLLKLIGGYLGTAKQNYITNGKLHDKKQEFQANAKELEEDKLLLEILCQDYTSVYSLNVETGKFRPLKLSVVANFHQMKRVRVNEVFDFEPNMIAYADAFVVSDKEAFKKFFSLEEIRKNLKDKAKATFRYQTTPNAGGYQYFEGQVVRIKRSSGQFHVMLAYHYIDDIIQQEKEDQRKLQKALDEVQRSNEIVSAIGQIYYSIFRIDLTKDWYDEVRSDNDVHRLTGNNGKASDKLKELCEKLVVTQHQSDVMRFFDLSTLPQRLSKEKTISLEYKATDGNWHQARFIGKKWDTTGHLTNVLYVTRVISETKRREERLISIAEEANRANEAKTDFLSRMAHDIRTPMNAVRGFTSIAKTQLHDPKKLEDSLYKIELAGAYLQQIVNDILDLTSIERGKFNLDVQETSLKQLLENYQDGMLQTFSTKKLDIHCRIHSMVYDKVLLDGLHLKQIYTNLFSNAMKYTPEGGSISIEIFEKELPGTNRVRLVYRISDTGIGMSSEYMKDMYNPFSRAVDTRVNHVRGSGLGLSIVKELVDLMGGHIDVQSELGKGTIFTVSFDVPYIEKEKAQPEAEISLDVAEGMHLLVAEDNDLNYEVAEELLAMYGVTCERAENGAICVEKFQKAPEGTYDAILMDMQMPVMNGLDATRAIRVLETGRAHKIPIIGLTANAFSTDMAACLGAGMNQHMAKPFDVKKLLGALIGLKK